jgi:hypothetical protein
MKLSSLPITTNLASRLFALGIRYESVFYWYQEKYQDFLTLFETGKSQNTMPWKQHIGKPSFENQNIFKEYPAYCCNELGEMLPGFIKTKDDMYYLQFEKKPDKWEYFYINYNLSKLVSVIGKTEQDARALLLIHIIENKYIDISQTIIK